MYSIGFEDRPTKCFRSVSEASIYHDGRVLIYNLLCSTAVGRGAKVWGAQTPDETVSNCDMFKFCLPKFLGKLTKIQYHKILHAFGLMPALTSNC